MFKMFFTIGHQTWNLCKLKIRTEGNNVSTLKPMEKSDVRENIQPNSNFHTFSTDPSYKYPNFPLQWKELFVSYPNLKSLSVHPVFRTEGYNNIDELLKELVEFQKENPDKLQNLKHLDVFSALNDRDMGMSSLLPAIHAFLLGGANAKDVLQCAVRKNHFEQAMELKFKLESLHMHFDEGGDRSYSETVTKYLVKLSPTLKTLVITCGVVHPMNAFPPPGNKISFPKLKDLNVELDVLSSNNVEFLEKTPILEKLTIGNLVGRATKPQLFSNTITMLPLDSLRHFQLMEDILTEDCIRKIREWFPNLSHFGAILDDKLLWAVYKFLNNSLEELDIKGKKVTDAGITGMQRIEGSYNNSSSGPKPSSSKKSEVEEPPLKKFKFSDTENRTFIGTSIGQMKKLREINLVVSYTSGGRRIECIQLTDDSVYNGFALLTELTNLRLSCCGESITEEAYRDLCSRRNILTLDTDRFYRGHGVDTTRFVRGRAAETKIEI